MHSIIYYQDSMGGMVIHRTSIAAVDVFCGAAGLSLGLKQAGIDVVAGIDVDPACRFPFEQNIGSTFVERDVSEVTGEDLKILFGGASVRVLAGCAPCQPFSGYTTKRRAIDERWQLLLEFLRLTKETLPEIVTMENVPRLVHLPLWTKFVDGLRRAGYKLEWCVLDASSYGVPQKRKRLVLIGSRLGPIRLPKANEGAPPTVRQTIGKLPAITAGARSKKDKLHSSRALTEVNLKRIQLSKPAGTWREWPAKMRVDCHRQGSGKTYPSVYGRMSWDQCSPTITTQFYGYGNGRFGHPVQNRAISLREGALLQSFPEDFKFTPDSDRVNFREIGRLIGNAVPPKLGKAIGSAIVDHVVSFSAESGRKSNRRGGSSK